MQFPVWGKGMAYEVDAPSPPHWMGEEVLLHDMTRTIVGLVNPRLAIENIGKQVILLRRKGLES
jgi:hypothetical protein